MKSYVFRNSTIEYLFGSKVSFSGYDEFSNTPQKTKNLLWLYFTPLDITENTSQLIIDNYLQRINYVLSQLSESQSLTIFTLSSRLIYLNCENSNERIKNSIDFFNKKIIELSKDHRGVKYIDIEDFFKDFSVSELLDWKFYFLSLMIINPNIGSRFKVWFDNKLNAINFIRKKCLILDLDNTLWGGIIGEDGIDGISLGGGYPGNVYKDFQKLIKRAATTGVIIAVCSKNNLDDVQEAWNSHPEMVLVEKDFSSMRINWEDKAKNIVEIADELNIGLDSIVFIDDNPRERDRVKSELPLVVVPDFPDEAYDLVQFFSNVYDEHFQVYQLTQEDARKTEQYKNNVKRTQLMSSVGTMDEYIQNLEIELSFFIGKNIPRVSQMTQKTNQFNLTTKRYSESDINKFLKEDCLLFSLGVKDKFGDNGITGASIVKLDKETNTAEIDSFLLSCRIIGKKIENVFMSLIANHLYGLGINTINASYIPTKKNIQTKEFYEGNGFQLANESIISRDYICKIERKIKIDNKFTIIK